jgi:hypothetical protein
MDMLPGLTYSQYYIAQDVEKLRDKLRAGMSLEVEVKIK